MAVIIQKYVSTINNKTLGKTYGRVRSIETVDLKGLAKHIHAHGSTFTVDEILGIVTKATSCIQELLLESKKVRLGDLGTFSLSALSTGEENAANFTMDNIKKLRIRFAPCLSKGDDNLNGYTMRSRAKMVDFASLSLSDDLSTDGDGGSGDNGDIPVINP